MVDRNAPTIPQLLSAIHGCTRLQNTAHHSVGILGNANRFTARSNDRTVWIDFDLYECKVASGAERITVLPPHGVQLSHVSHTLRGVQAQRGVVLIATSSLTHGSCRSCPLAVVHFRWPWQESASVGVATCRTEIIVFISYVPLIRSRPRHPRQCVICILQWPRIARPLFTQADAGADCWWVVDGSSRGKCELIWHLSPQSDWI